MEGVRLPLNLPEGSDTLITAMAAVMATDRPTETAVMEIWSNTWVI